MKIIIAGAGDVGFHLAKLLSSESQDIVLIDEKSAVLDYAQSHMDVIVQKGDSTSIRTLRDAGVKNADLLIAVTSAEQTNIVTAVLAKKMGAKTTVARVRKEEYLLKGVQEDFKRIGIDSLFSPRSLASKEICRLVHEASFNYIQEFEGGKLCLVGSSIGKNSSLVDQTISETSLTNGKYKPIAIKRGKETIIPNANCEIHLNDRIYFMSNPAGIDKVMEVTGKKRVKIKNVMILGGSSIGVMTAKMLEKTHNVKLIERNSERCYALAEQLSNTLIVHGNGSNVELLEEEGLSEMGAFIAMTGNSETNIISSLVAKNHGVYKTIALVENIDYIGISQDIGVDTLINRKLIVANDIFKHVRKGRVKAMMGIHGVDAEVIEYEVQAGSRITKKPLKQLNFPKNAMIGGVIRGEESFLDLTDFKVEEGDKLIIFTLPEALSKVEQFIR